MEKLPIGEVIFKLRKEKNITQDQLGNFIGVSTAAVSKWESGISYPDITLLPILATFFNVSIDVLLNYNIEISEDEVMKIFRLCEAEFSTGNLEKAVNFSKDYVLKHPSSYLLKLRIGFLFTMYSWKGKGEDEYMNMIAYAIGLFEDVAKNCSKVELVEAALFQLGALYSGIGEEDKAIEALNKINKSQCDPNDILASIYIQKNELKKGRELLQSKLYKSIHDVSLICMALANSYSKHEKDLSLVEKYYNLAIKIKEAFLPEAASVIGLSTEYLNFAQSYLKFKEKEKAIEMLKKMVVDMRRNDINRLGKFKYIWCFNEIPDGEPTITMNLYENLYKIFEGEEFDLIRESYDFKEIVKDLKCIEKTQI